MLTYGDGLSDIDLIKLQSLHTSNDNLVTLSGVFPPPRFGGLKIAGNQINSFIEKPENEVSRVNGGFMMCNKNIKPLANFEDGRKSLALAEKAIHSTKSKKFEKINLI